MAWNRRWVIAAFLVGLAMLAAAMVLRPLWRDEYWGLYYSNPTEPLLSLIANKITQHEHPAFYYVLLYAWRSILDADLWARAINLIFMAGAGAWIWRLGRDRAWETVAFFLLCVTSYWSIFYATEVRMYYLLFAGCAVSIYLARHALEEGRPSVTALGYFAVGLAVAFSHYFGTLWIAVLGFWTGLAFARRGNWGAFLAWGFASALAIAPAAAWALAVRPEATVAIAGAADPLGDKFAYAANQFLRGLIVKTFGSNLAAFIAAGLCAGALIRRRQAIDAVLALAIGSTVLIAFALHLFYTPIIKERGFIVVMPALILLAVRAMGEAGEGQTWARRLIAWTPLVAVVSPFLFVGEFFKDRERLSEVRRLISESGACRDAPVGVYFREAVQADDWSRFVVERALRGAAGGGDLRLIDIAGLAGRSLPESPGCRLRALAPLLSKGEGPMHAAVRDDLRAAGLDLERLEERRLGAGRTLVFLARE